MAPQRVVLVMCAQWVCLLAAIAGGMAAERLCSCVDLRVIIACVVVAGGIGGMVFRSHCVARAVDLLAGSALFVASNAVIEAMMLVEGPAAHVAGSFLCAVVTASVFGVVSVRRAEAPRRAGAAWGHQRVDDRASD